MNITNVNNLPQPFVDAVTREYQYRDKQYSVTSLLKGVCQTLLERRHSDAIEQDVSDMVWMLFGTAAHSILENSKETSNQLKENRIAIDVGDYKLSGIFDLYDDDTKTVTDYKTGTVWKVMFDEWDDYHKQLLMYAYMLRKIGFDCENGQIVMILKDHSKTKAKLDPTYPKYPVYVKKFNFTDEDFANIENFINERFKAYKQYENVPDALLPPCTKEERWHKDDKYAVMKKGRKTAIKLCDSEEEANSKVAELGTGHYVEFREGKDGRCDDYCQVKDFCPFYRKKQSV